MSGHSKWSSIKRQKGVTDAKRGQLFTKLGREITIAARNGGGDSAANFRLRLAVQKARAENMPNENIERAIKKGIGEGEAAALEEITYEGYGPGGAAIIVEAMTDNRNRTAAEVRSTFSRNGGSLGESGCVAWQFESKGIILTALQSDAEQVALVAIDAGADDVIIEEDSIEVYTVPEDIDTVRQALEGNEVPVQSAEVTLLPTNTLELDAKEAAQTLRLLERLEELDDVQRVYTNAIFPAEVAAAG